MPPRKRRLSSSIPRNEPTKKQVSHKEAAQNRFEEVFKDSTMGQVNPARCFPLIVDRDRHPGCVSKMVRILSGETENEGLVTDSNVCTGSGTPVVVPVSELYRPLLIRYLKDNGANDATISEELEETWYGVIDGVYRLWALLELRETRSDQWRSFRWMVLILKGSPSLECLRQMKRSFEENRKSENLIEVTLYDEYSRMQEEYKRLTRLNGKPPSEAAVATAYDGRRHHSQDAVSQKVRTAMLLSPDVLTALGEIMNKECPALKADQLLDNHPAKSVDITARYVDTRVFATFVTNNSFNGARLFLNNVGEDNDEALCTLYSD